MRPDDRPTDELRPITITHHFTNKTPGSILIRAGETMVLCTASISDKLPPWMNPEELRGWVTAEYSMMPGSTSPRKSRDRNGKVDGRSTEIQRLVGRSLRAVVDLELLGQRLITLDCDVLQADGGTRTLSITGSMIALLDALETIPEFAGKKPGDKGFPVKDYAAAVSVGLVEGEPRLDLCYLEDSAAEVDMNVVMTAGGRFIEIQGTGEEATFDEKQLTKLLKLAKKGIGELVELEK
ncbi:MAG: ribonuclease PH [Thermoguttaceae bacterium]|nr:ribonuclease PH [Thermoguttaceae bacterium]MDO4858143.1 ribonuclease PH [Thermoguttaceae bacterium]